MIHFDPEYSQDDSSPLQSVSAQYAEAVRRLLAGLPLLAPSDMADELERLGYMGQTDQRRALSLMAYRHIRRIKRLHVDRAPALSLPPKQNVLMLGPTGCGKTYLVELLFQNILRLPTVIVDITSFTESGYVGDDVRTILTRLIINAGGNPYLAMCGIVCLDEFDKIASSGSSARFAGQGTTKDVSGYGVQRELLAMLQGAEVAVPMDYGYSEYGQRIRLSTRDIPFIACGAFSGISELAGGARSAIGFHSSDADPGGISLDDVGLFQKYGFLPELMGRFSRILTFPPLSADTLKQILTRNVLPQFQKEFQGEGLELTVTESALSHLVERSLKHGTGARGLQLELVSAIEKAAFETFMRRSGAEVVITVKDGRLDSEIHGGARKDQV